jgi:hypothetical protein
MTKEISLPCQVCVVLCVTRMLWSLPSFRPFSGSPYQTVSITFSSNETHSKVCGPCVVTLCNRTSVLWQGSYLSTDTDKTRVTMRLDYVLEKYSNQSRLNDTKRNEMKLILKSRKPKRLMGMKAYHHGFKSTNSLEWQSNLVV